MGETAIKIFNVLGLSTMFFAFLANLAIYPFISVGIAVVGLIFGIFQVLQKREDWLYRRAERRQREHDFKKHKTK